MSWHEEMVEDGAACAHCATLIGDGEGCGHPVLCPACKRAEDEYEGPADIGPSRHDSDRAAGLHFAMNRGRYD